MNPSDFREAILHRLKSGNNTQEDLEAVAAFAANGSVPDYQLTAWLTAAYLKPLNLDETAILTLAMARTGQRLDLTGLSHPWIDKHSTGGVGDKTSIVLMPLLASLGITMVKMSGRGLGVTGGTVDKMESIPGFRSDLTPQEMIAQAKQIGIAWTGQTPDLAPADKVLYSLRDAIGAVDSIPLIVSSILSKKIAGGAEMVMLDVKCGSGAFMHDLEGARALAHSLVETGKRAGLPTHATITDMSQPLGTMVGNALEVREAISVLNGATGRFTELCLELAAETLAACGKASTIEEGKTIAQEAIAAGVARDKANEWIIAQGGPSNLLENPGQLPAAPVVRNVVSQASGWVARVDAGTVGLAVIDLGGGRHRKEDVIDHSVGMEVLKAVGDEVLSSETIFRVHAKSEEDAATAAAQVLEGFQVSDKKIAPEPLILERIS